MPNDKTTAARRRYRGAQLASRVVPPAICAIRILAWVGCVTVASIATASAAPITIYAAGSLSGVMQALIEASGQPADVFAKPVYGPAGMLAERLQKGETADLFASADLAAPNRLADVRKDTLVVPFVRNRMCVAANTSLRQG